MTSSQLIPALLVPLVAWRIYVRVRRNIGRQAFNRRRILSRTVVLSAVTLGLAYMAGANAAALGCGLLLGAPIAWMGLRLTAFETTPEGLYYIPNTALGLAISALFLGRLIYRFIGLGGFSATTRSVHPALFQSPLTLGLVGLTFGYYVTYNLGLLWRAGHVSGPVV